MACTKWRPLVVSLARSTRAHVFVCVQVKVDGLHTLLCVFVRVCVCVQVKVDGLHTILCVCL